MKGKILKTIQNIYKPCLWGGLMGLLLLFIACNSDDELLPLVGSNADIVFNIGIENNNRTRVSTGADFKSQFEAGDEVGIFAVKRASSATASLQASGNHIHNVKLTLQSDGAWLANTKIVYPNSTEVLDFYAYYPYDASWTEPTNVTFNVQANQSTASNFSASDLMSATHKGVAKGATVDFSFVHQLALVQVNVETGVDFTAFDTDFKVTLKNMQTHATFYWANGTITTGSKTDIVMHPVGNSTYRALVPAQSIAKDAELFAFEQTRSTIQSYHADEDITLEAGKASVLHDIVLDTPTFDPNHVYDIGDYYPYKGKPIGIVYEISNGGKGGMIMSLDEATLQWSTEYKSTESTDTNNGLKNMQKIKEYVDTNHSGSWDKYPAFKWVHDKNDLNVDYNTARKGIWYLPAKEELKALHNTCNSYGKNTFNKLLVQQGNPPLTNNYYWSSSEYSINYAWVVYLFGYGDQYYFSKSNNYRVRCVSAF